MKTSKIAKTTTLCLLGIGGLSSASNAMQTVSFSRHAMQHHGMGTMHRIHPGIQLRQNHTSNNHYSGRDETVWLCPIKESDIQTLSKAGLKLGEHVQDIKKDVVRLHDLLNESDNISYNKARNWDDHLANQFYHLHDLHEEIKEQRRAAEAAEEAAMSNVIGAIRISFDHLGCNLHGISPNPIHTHSITQTKGTIAIDLNTKPIEDHEIWKTNNFNWKNSNEVSKLGRVIRTNFEGKLDLQKYLLQSVHLIELFLQKDNFVFTRRGFREESDNIQTNININVLNRLKSGEIFSPKEIELIQNSRTGLEKMNEDQSIKETVSVVYSDLASGIKEEELEALSMKDSQLAHLGRSIKDCLVQFDVLINKVENKKHDKLLTKNVEFARSMLSPFFLELASAHPPAKSEFDHLSADTLDIADALERLSKRSGSDPRNNWENVENDRCNFEKNAHKLMQMDGISDDIKCEKLINVVRELFNTYQEENGIRRSKENRE